jgi:CRISPR/Cas system CSM-associated protein Csm2 small subunit
MAPYVPLTDVEPLKVKGCICGSTNLLFESKMNDWYQFCGSVAKKKVLYEKEIKLENPELNFIEGVLESIKKGKSEEEVREDFENFTISFLSSVLFSKFHSSMQEDISVSNLVLIYF